MHDTVILTLSGAAAAALLDAAEHMHFALTHGPHDAERHSRLAILEAGMDALKQALRAGDAHA